jgi:hypothetical protein
MFGKEKRDILATRGEACAATITGTRCEQAAVFQSALDRMNELVQCSRHGSLK